MAVGLPTVTKDTALLAMCDLIRQEMAADENDDTGGAMTDAILIVAKENPEILESVNCMTEVCTMAERMAALAGMAITYRALKAQAEIEELKALERLQIL